MADTLPNYYVVLIWQYFWRVFEVHDLHKLDVLLSNEYPDPFRGPTQNILILNTFCESAFSLNSNQAQTWTCLSRNSVKFKSVVNPSKVGGHDLAKDNPRTSVSTKGPQENVDSRLSVVQSEVFFTILIHWMTVSSIFSLNSLNHLYCKLWNQTRAYYSRSDCGKSEGGTIRYRSNVAKCERRLDKYWKTNLSATVSRAPLWYPTRDTRWWGKTATRNHLCICVRMYIPSPFKSGETYLPVAHLLTLMVESMNTLDIYTFGAIELKWFGDSFSTTHNF